MSEIKISFGNIETQEQLETEVDKCLSALHHIFLLHWEISPDSVKETTDMIWNFMMAFGNVYARLLAEGKIPDDKKLQPLMGEKRYDA